MPYGKPKLKGTSNVTSAKQAPASLKGGNKQAPPSLKGATKRKVSAMGSKNPIGPQTKRETKKTARVAKREDRKILTPMTPVGIQAEKEKELKNRKKAAIAVGATVGTIGAGLYSMYLDKTKPGRNERKSKKARGL